MRYPPDRRARRRPDGKHETRLALPRARDRDRPADRAARAPGGAAPGSGHPRVRVEPVLPDEARCRRGEARAGADARRPLAPALHDQGRAEAGSGRSPALGDAARRALRAMPARAHDVGNDRPPARVPRHERRLVRVLSLVRALALGVRHPSVRHGDGRVLVRAVDRLLVGVLCRAGRGGARVSGRRALDGSAHRRAHGLSDHGAGMHAVVCPVPRRAGIEEGHRSGPRDQDPDHVAHGRAGCLDPRHQGQDRGGVRRPSLRPAGPHRDRRLGVRVRRARRAHARPRGLLLPRGARRAGPAGRARRAWRARVHEPLSQGDAADPLPHARHRPALRSAVPLRPDARGVRGGRAGAPGRYEEGARHHRLPAAHRGDRQDAGGRGRVPGRLAPRRGARRHPGPRRSGADTLAGRARADVPEPRRGAPRRPRHPRHRGGYGAGRPAALGPQGSPPQGRAHRSSLLVTPIGGSVIGARIPRVEDARFLAGQGRYVADLEPAGTLQVAFLRSPHAHARLVSIDTARARAMPGVVACLTGDELAASVRAVRAPSRMRDYRVTEHPSIARGKIRHAGEAVAAVAAESRYAAEDAVEAIDVAYAPLPPVTDPETALQPDAPLVHEEAGTNVLLSRTFTRGDVTAAFGGAATIVSDRFRFHRHAGVSLEIRACLAEWRAGELTLWWSTQVPGVLRDALAEVLAMPAHRIRVVAPDVGGGFGLKTMLYPEEVVVCALATRLGRPVKWVGDRREDLVSSTQAWDEIVDAELAVDTTGAIRGLRARVVADVGAYSIYPWTASIEVIQVVSFLPGPYRVEHYAAEALGVATNKAPMGPYRGVGRPVSVFVAEALLDRAARRLGLDPVAVRRANLLTPEELPYRSASGIVWDSGAFVESLELACETADYAALRADQARAREAGRTLGIGVACYVELTGVGSAIPVSPGAAVANGTGGETGRGARGGRGTDIFGLACHGQGHETSLAQVVAGELGVPVERIRVVHGDTALSPHGTGTYASRSAVLGGGAAILAARAVRDKALAIAAHRLEVDVADLEIAGGAVRVRGVPDRAATLAELATMAYTGRKRLPEGMEPGLEATRFYDPYFGTASSATHLAVVEVDVATAAVRILRYVVAEDCGRIINPMIVEGQTTGGVVQGAGAALLEEVVYDGAGQSLTASLMDYLVPTASEAPRVEIVHIERPSPTTLGGFKGVGEGGTIGAPAAIACAIADALAPMGIEVGELPMTGERLYRLLARRKGAS